MELKQGWTTLKEGVSQSFNRTFMELKPKNAAFGTKDADGFNRTFMELKLICDIRQSECG